MAVNFNKNRQISLFFQSCFEIGPLVIVPSRVSSVIMIDMAERFAETRERKREKGKSKVSECNSKAIAKERERGKRN